MFSSSVRAGVVRVVLLHLLVLAALGCTENVPPVFISMPPVAAQDDSWSCGPNSAARMLKRYGFPVTYASLREDARDISALPAIGIGLPPKPLRDLLSLYHPNAAFETEVSFERVRELLRSGRPVIALIQTRDQNVLGVTIPILHWIVLAGFDDVSEEVSYYDTRDNWPRTRGYTEFRKLWDWHLDQTALVDQALAANTAKPRSIVWIDADPDLGMPN